MSKIIIENKNGGVAITMPNMYWNNAPWPGDDAVREKLSMPTVDMFDMRPPVLVMIEQVLGIGRPSGITGGRRTDETIEYYYLVQREVTYL